MLIVEEINWNAIAALITPVLYLAEPAYLINIRAAAEAEGIAQAVSLRDTPALYDWLIGIAELQGISDRSASAFSSKHGRVTWEELDHAFSLQPSCLRLKSYWHFSDCGYRKTEQFCSNPLHRDHCCVPRMPLRNGRLSQGAASLFLFLRDVCNGDLVGWIDHQLQRVDQPDASPAVRASLLREAVLAPMRNIFGLGDKVLSMALADLLLGGDLNRERWVAAGAGMIAVDSLVHNFLHRTGMLKLLGADHSYGPACFRADGCVGVIEELAIHIDAREFDPVYPAYFPRWLQSAVWNFCALDRLNICNGLKIDDRQPCVSSVCAIENHCDRVPPTGVTTGT